MTVTFDTTTIHEYNSQFAVYTYVFQDTLIWHTEFKLALKLHACPRLPNIQFEQM